MKRITSGVLAALLLMGAMFANPMQVWADPADETQAAVETTETTAPATTDSTTGSSTQTTTPGASEEEKKEETTGPSISDECMAILKQEEGFSKTPYWDYTQWTVGYGTRCPEDKRAEYTANGISEEDAEILLRNHLVGIYEDLLSYADKNSITFTQNQFDALILFSYNCGTGWVYDSKGTLYNAVRKGATGNDLIRAFTLWCNAGGEIKDYLLRRRLSESAMYLEGKYGKYPPDNYCYVLYDANGGTTSPRSQGYDSDLTVAPYPVPTYSGHSFEGWYTQKNGGTKVTVLDASTKNKTLYAHWKDAEGNQVTTEEKEVNATVTANDVNVRKGPGTNYTTVGTKNKGDKILITETASGSGLRWGKFDGGWICLTYTNYDSAGQEEETSKPDDPTGTDTTQPTTTPTTQPTTKPEESTTAKVYGVVKANGGLNVRKGTSTGHAVIGQLPNNTRVEILEQKTVGSMVWGRIEKGWISMSYVKLESTGSTDSTGSTGTTGSTNTTTQSWTGKVTNISGCLNIRSGAGTNYAIAGRLYSGDKVTITEQKTVGGIKWGKIDKGWISMDYVKLDSSTGSTGSTENSGTTGSTNTTISRTGSVTASSLNIRSYAGTASTVVGSLSKGSRVTVTQTTVVGGTTWGKIEKGWISMDYVKLDSSTGSTGSTENSGTTGSTDTSTQGWTGKVYNCSDYLNVRNGAGTSYGVVGYYYPGDKVTITEKKTVGSTTWGKTDKGWISMYYVKLDGTTGSTGNTGTTDSKTVTASCLYVRKTAGNGAVVGYLYYGAKVSIVETTTVNGVSWGRTSQGWICMSYVK